MGNAKERWKDKRRFVVEFLWSKIECLRQEMHVMALEKGISHSDVLMVSQRLDEAINELYKIILVQTIG